MADQVIRVNDLTPTISIIRSEDGPVAGPQGIQGPVGSRGEQGYSVLSGVGAPQAAFGRVGDFYLDESISAPALYGPKTSAGWGSGRPLRGPQGFKGDKGDKGDKGLTGATGSVTYAGSGTAATAARSDHKHEPLEVFGHMIGPNRNGSEQLYRKEGTVNLVTANNHGDINFTFPTPFPNGIISMHFTPGDHAPGYRLTSATPWLASWSRYGGIVYMLHLDPQGNGGAVPQGVQCRLNYSAIGY